MIEVDVVETVAKNVEADIMQRIEKGAHDGLVALAMMTQTEAQRRILKGPKTGRVYGRHRASAPGEAPANDTGHLVGSLHITSPQPNEVDLGALAPYAVHLEYGTRHMKPRPFLRVSAEKVGKDGERVIAAAVDAALK